MENQALALRGAYTTANYIIWEEQRSCNGSSLGYERFQHGLQEGHGLFTTAILPRPDAASPSHSDGEAAHADRLEPIAA